MHMPPDLVLFDCDGVLVDSEPLTSLVIQSSLARYGLDVSLDHIDTYFVGGTMMGVRDTALSKGARLPETWLDDIYTEMFDKLAAEVEPVPGIVAVLDALDAAGIPYAVGSNGPHRKMQITLRRCGLYDRLAGRIVSREDVPNPKPAPDVYLTAAAAIGIDPVRAVVVEDSPNGATAGKAAGCLTFGFTAHTKPARLEPICDRIFDDMADLPGMLGL